MAGNESMIAERLSSVLGALPDKNEKNVRLVFNNFRMHIPGDIVVNEKPFGHDLEQFMERIMELTIIKGIGNSQQQLMTYLPYITITYDSTERNVKAEYDDSLIPSQSRLRCIATGAVRFKNDALIPYLRVQKPYWFSDDMLRSTLQSILKRSAADIQNAILCGMSWGVSLEFTKHVGKAVCGLHLLRHLTRVNPDNFHCLSYLHADHWLPLLQHQNLTMDEIRLGLDTMSTMPDVNPLFVKECRLRIRELDIEARELMLTTLERPKISEGDTIKIAEQLGASGSIELISQMMKTGIILHSDLKSILTLTTAAAVCKRFDVVRWICNELRTTDLIKSLLGALLTGQFKDSITIADVHQVAKEYNITS